MYQPLFYSLLLLLPFAYFFLRRFLEKKFQSALVEAMSEDTSAQQAQSTGNTSGSIMQPAREDLAPQLDHPYTVEELKAYDGSDPSKPILVAIKGTVFDVTRKADVYGPGKSYNLFAGKDGSRALGMSSLKPEDASSDYSTLDESERKVLEDWEGFFTKRYNIVGKVVDLPNSSL